MYPGEYSTGRADSVRLPRLSVPASPRPSRKRARGDVVEASPLASREKRKNLTFSVRNLDARVPQDDSDDEPAPKRSGRPAKGAKGDAPAKTAKRAKAAAFAAGALRKPKATAKPETPKKPKTGAKKPRESGKASDEPAPKKRGPGRPPKDDKARKRPKPPVAAEKKSAARTAAEAKPAPRSRPAASGKPAKGAVREKPLKKPKRADLLAKRKNASSVKRDAEASVEPAKAPRPRGRPPAASKGDSGGAPRQREAPPPDAPAAKKSRGATKKVGGEKDAEADEALADAGARDAAMPADQTTLPAAAFPAAETKTEGAAKRVVSDAARRSPESARASGREGPPPPVFVVHGQYRTADEVTRDAAKAVREAEAAAAAAERAAEEAERREREAWEAERLASELLDEAERQKRAADAEGGVEGRDGNPVSRAMWAA